MGDPLVLSIFPGLDLLGRAFDEAGFCVVRGPDPLWGGDIRGWHPPAGMWHGVVGGPPCQAFSRLRFINPRAGQKHGNLIPEFERVVAEAQPVWFLMENVTGAPEPVVPGYLVRSLVFNNRWTGAEQHRVRRFSFGTRDGRALVLDVALFEAPLEYQAVTSSAERVPVRLERDGKGGHQLKSALRPPTVSAEPGPAVRHAGIRYTVAEMCRLQGLPEDFADQLPFTSDDKRKVIGNGVPLPTGRAIARGVRRALDLRGSGCNGSIGPAAGRTTTMTREPISQEVARAALDLLERQLTHRGHTGICAEYARDLDMDCLPHCRDVRLILVAAGRMA